MVDGTHAEDSAAIFERFVAAINAHDLDALSALMTSDHLFVDSLGNRVQGATSMRAGWGGYFAMCPDYWLQVEKLISAGDTVLATGEAGGTIDAVAWRTPAAWKAVVAGRAISEWRVFADNKPVYDILAKRKR